MLTVSMAACFAATLTASCSGSLAATHCVQEFALSVDGDWTLTRGDIVIGDAKVFAPANLRATADNAAYASLVQRWMQQRYTLRYTGGMVPDVHHILTKVRRCPPFRVAERAVRSRMGALNSIRDEVSRG